MAVGIFDLKAGCSAKKSVGTHPNNYSQFQAKEVSKRT